MILRTQAKANVSQTVTYSFIDGSEEQNTKVEEIVKEIAKLTNLTFLQYSRNGAIRISFKDATTSWSFVGTQAKRLRLNEPTLNLGCINTEVVSNAEAATIWHQLAHALGLLHEHESPSTFRILTFSGEGERSAGMDSDDISHIVIIASDVKTTDPSSWTAEENKNARQVFGRSQLSKYSQRMRPIM